MNERTNNMTTKELLLDAGYDEVIIILENYSYDSALIGVSDDNRAIYDFDKMVEWIIKVEEFEDEIEAIEWIEYNTIRALPYIGENAPIIMYSLHNEK